MGPAFDAISNFSHFRATRVGPAVRGGLSLLAGCGEQAPKFAEPRDVGDKVTDADLDTFFQVVDELPDKKLPEMPALFKSPPAWDEQRTLPVNELVREESDELEKLWNDEHLIRHLAKDRALQKALRERMSPAQFVGLVKTIGAALARNAVRPDQDLRLIVEQGKRRLGPLAHKPSVSTSWSPMSGTSC